MEEHACMKLFFNARAADWDAHCAPPDASALRALFLAAGVQEGLRVLDIACGTGVLFPSLLETSPALLHGIDLSAEMARLAREKHPDPRARVFEEDFYTFSSGTRYDLAVSYNAYPHFMDKARFVRQLHALLAPHGRFLVLHKGGRAQINACHSHAEAEHISVPLLPCAEEAKRFQGLFRIDMQLDTDACYVLSGTKR